MKLWQPFSFFVVVASLQAKDESLESGNVSTLYNVDSQLRKNEKPGGNRIRLGTRVRNLKGRGDSRSKSKSKSSKSKYERSNGKKSPKIKRSNMSSKGKKSMKSMKSTMSVDTNDQCYAPNTVNTEALRSTLKKFVESLSTDSSTLSPSQMDRGYHVNAEDQVTDWHVCTVVQACLDPHFMLSMGLMSRASRGLAYKALSMVMSQESYNMLQLQQHSNMLLGEMQDWYVCSFVEVVVHSRRPD